MNDSAIHTTVMYIAQYGQQDTFQDCSHRTVEQHLLINTCYCIHSLKLNNSISRWNFSVIYLAEIQVSYFSFNEFYHVHFIDFSSEQPSDCKVFACVFSLLKPQAYKILQLPKFCSFVVNNEAKKCQLKMAQYIYVQPLNC